MKKVSVSLENLLEQLPEENIALAIESNDVRAAWDDDDCDEKHEKHDRDDDDDECECKEKREGNNGLHLGICKH